MKTVKLASCRYLDGLPTAGGEAGHAFRDLEMEAAVHDLTQKMGIGAQFGGKYFGNDVRVIRLPRHGASLPIGQIGRASGRDRVCQCGEISVVGVSLKKKKRVKTEVLG